MTTDLDRSTAPLTSILSRRSLIGASALAVPAVLAVTTTPAFAVSADSLSIVVSPTTVAAGESAVVTATVKSSAGVAAAGRAVSLTSSASSVLSFSPASGTTQSDGTFRSTVTASASASAQTVTITAVEGTVSASAALRMERYTVSASVTPSTSYHGESATVVAAVADSSGAAAPGRTVSWSTGTAGVSFAAPTGTTNGSGQYVTTVRSTTSSTGDSAVLKAVTGGAEGSTTWTLVGVVIRVVVNNGPNIARGKRGLLSITVKDSNGNALSGKSLTLETDWANTTVNWGLTAGSSTSVTTTTSSTGGATGNIAVGQNAAVGTATLKVTCLGTTVFQSVPIV